MKRPGISVKGATYAHLKALAEQAGLSVGKFADQKISEKLTELGVPLEVPGVSEGGSPSENEHLKTDSQTAEKTIRKGLDTHSDPG